MQTYGELCAAETHRIVVTNISNEETFQYSLALIKGKILTVSQHLCCNLKENNIILHHVNTSSSFVTDTNWPVHNAVFKCLVSLKIGTNKLILEFNKTKFTFTIAYHPRKTVFDVIPVYIVCQGHDGKFQAPAGVDNSVQSACSRIAIGARLIQCLTAEKLYEANGKRKTFQLEHDMNPSAPECHVFHSLLPVEKARSMDPESLWQHFGRELMTSPLGREDRKLLAFLSCTRYNPCYGLVPDTHQEMLAAMEAHVALGGGGLAIFGTACLYTWPGSVGDIVGSFLDNSRVDPSQFMDDSCYRGTMGGCFATTLGSVCHELGHTFDLGHSREGIMGRGFDNMDLVFTVRGLDNNDDRDSNRNIAGQHSTVTFTKVLNVSYKQPIKRPQEDSNNEHIWTEPTAIETTCNPLTSSKNDVSSSSKFSRSDNDLTFWSKGCSILLDFHRWFNEDVPQQLRGKLSYDVSGREFSSGAGVRIVEVRDDAGLVVSSWHFLDGRGIMSFQVPSHVLSGAAFLLVAEDSEGNTLQRPVSMKAQL